MVEDTPTLLAAALHIHPELANYARSEIKFFLFAPHLYGTSDEDWEDFFTKFEDHAQAMPQTGSLRGAMPSIDCYEPQLAEGWDRKHMYTYIYIYIHIYSPNLACEWGFLLVL